MPSAGSSISATPCSTGSVSRPHVVLVGAVQDPQVRAWANGPVATSDEANRQAQRPAPEAARDLVESGPDHPGTRTGGRPAAGGGSTVVDVPPGPAGQRGESA